MPEGPSLVILRELIEELNLEGAEILKVSGTTDLDKERMLHQKVKSFKTWGKHFLICFDDFTLRIHLMMFGSYRINDHKDSDAKIGFEFKNAVLNFYTCDLVFIEGDLTKVYDWKVDIMSDDWSSAKAIKKLRNEPESLICDVLLDQQIFSGSGNIIKNEVLYRTKIHPLNTISSIPAAKLKKLVANTRAYAFDFLKWKKANVLSKHWEVYSQKKCPKNHQVEKQNLGKNKRVTYFCPTCQKRYAKR